MILQTFKGDPACQITGTVVVNPIYHRASLALGESGFFSLVDPLSSHRWTAFTRELIYEYPEILD